MSGDGKITMHNPICNSPYVRRRKTDLKIVIILAYQSSLLEGADKYIEIYTLANKPTIMLTAHGYVYTPGGVNWFTFQVKMCRDASVNLYNEEGEEYVYRVLLGGWQNRKSSLSERDIVEYVVHTEDNVISCTEYRRFWISWRDDNIEVGRGPQLYRDTLMILRPAVNPVNIRYVGLKSHVNGHWLIPDSGFIQQQHPMAWQLLPGFMNTNMTKSITWTISVNSMKDCAVACHRRPPCVSFVYHSDEGKCQGHSVNFKTISEGQGKVQYGSFYYVQP